MEDIKTLMEFVQAAIKATSDCNHAKFECPICGEIAHASKAKCNGHVHAQCNGCKMNFMQ